MGDFPTNPTKKDIQKTDSKFFHSQIGQFFVIFVHAFQLVWKNECNYPMAFVYFIGGHALLFFILVRNKMVRSFLTKLNYELRHKTLIFLEKRQSCLGFISKRQTKLKMKHVRCMLHFFGCLFKMETEFLIPLTSLVIRFQQI